MKLRIRVQQHLVVAHRESDPPDWVFTLCRTGLQEWIGQRLRPGEQWLIEVTGNAIELIKELEMANWSLDYKVVGNSPGNKRIKLDFHELGNGFALKLGGGIPAGGPALNAVSQLAQKHLAGIDDLDADDPKNHAKCLRACAEYCLELADVLDGDSN